MDFAAQESRTSTWRHTGLLYLIRGVWQRSSTPALKGTGRRCFQGAAISDNRRQVSERKQSSVSSKGKTICLPPGQEAPWPGNVFLGDNLQPFCFSLLIKAGNQIHREKLRLLSLRGTARNSPAVMSAELVHGEVMRR